MSAGGRRRCVRGKTGGRHEPYTNAKGPRDDREGEKRKSGSSNAVVSWGDSLPACNLVHPGVIAMPTSAPAMHELRLLFTPAEHGSFTVHLDDVPGHAVGVPAALTPFLDEGDYETLRWSLEDYMDLPDGGSIVRAQGVEAQINDWGQRLHDAVFAAPENARELQTLLDAPEPRGLTIATDLSALLRLPWELVSDAAGPLAQRVAVR